MSSQSAARDMRTLWTRLFRRLSNGHELSIRNRGKLDQLSHNVVSGLRGDSRYDGIDVDLTAPRSLKTNIGRRNVAECKYHRGANQDAWIGIRHDEEAVGAVREGIVVKCFCVYVARIDVCCQETPPL